MNYETWLYLYPCTHCNQVHVTLDKDKINCAQNGRPVIGTEIITYQRVTTNVANEAGKEVKNETSTGFKLTEAIGY